MVTKLSNTSPIVSIIIPVYNCRKELKRAINSVLEQSFKDFEILVVDDGSTDDIQSLVELYDLGSIKYFKLQHQNANVARNVGIKQAQGRYIAMLDADDEWLKNHLEINIKLIENNKCDGVYGSVKMKISDGYEQIFPARNLQEGERMINYLLSQGIGAHTSTLFMKKSVACNILWDESLGRHQDYDFVIRFSKEYKWIVNKEVTAIYHIQSNKKKDVDYESCMKFIKSYKKEIVPKIYNHYHSRMLNNVRYQNCGKNIISHYAKNSVKYPKFLSHEKYFSIIEPDNRLSHLYHKLRFIIKNI